MAEYNNNSNLNNNMLKLKKVNIGNVLKENIQKIAILGMSILYILQGIFEFRTKETTILEIIGNVALSFVIGILIKDNLVSLGLRDGRRSDDFKNSLQYYAQVKEQATEYFDKLPEWCRYKNAKELEWLRQDIITMAGLSWKGYKYGYYELHPEKLNEEQQKAIQRCKDAKISKLSSDELLSDLPSAKKKFGKRFGIDEKEYQLKTNIQSILSKIATAMICGFFTLSPLINASNWKEVLAKVLWNAIQIIMWLTFGVISYANAKGFILNEYRQTHIIQKTEYLNEFIQTMKKEPQVIEEFNKDVELDEYINEFVKERTEKSNNNNNNNIDLIETNNNDNQAMENNDRNE